ncbi:MAG: phosphatidate cytidylyltransferase [Sphingomonadaceae bacterium]
MLVQRVLSALVLAPLVIIAIVLGAEWFAAVSAVVVLIANWEFYSLLRRAGHSPLVPFGFLLSIGFLLDAYLLPGRIAPVFLAFSLLVSLLWLVGRQRLDTVLVDWALTWVPPLYVAFLGAYWVSLRLLPSGERWVLLVVGVTWATDIAAYFVGHAFGRRRFFARISPRKTVEGAVAGFIAGVACGALLAWLFGLDVLRLLAFSVIAAMAAEAGDLAESLMKRQLRTKDASHLIPGHGGLLDRMDSLLFVGVLAYYWAIWVGTTP